MINIAICDDNASELNATVGITTDFMTERGICNYKLYKYNNPESLLSDIQKNKFTFQLILLDVIMPRINGIELGKAIKKDCAETEIIYLSMSKEFAIDSYSANAFYYLLKPINRQKFYEVLDLFMQKRDTAKIQSINIKTAQGIFNCELTKISHGSLQNRQAQFVLNNGEKIISTTIRTSFLEYLQPLLENPAFAMSSASDFVNFIYVSKIGIDEILMKDKSKITLSRKHKTELKESFFNFFKT
ncbi:MAG: response regulator [Bacillota bacterium]